MKMSIYGLTLVFSVLAHAESSTTKLATPNASASVLQTTQSDQKVTGALEFRPTYGAKEGEVHSENTFEGGYQFNKNLSVGYVQWFENNIYNSGTASSGLNAALKPGFLRVKAKEIWTNTRGTSLSYEGQVFMPTDASWRDTGRLSALRNWFSLKQKLNSVVSLTLYEVPILHVHTSPGGTTGGKLKANPNYENRVYLEAGFQITEKLGFSVPLLFESVRYANYQAGADKNDSWSHTFYVWPEVNYSLNDNMTLGVAYRSENLIAPDFSATNINSGLETGVAQVILRASL